MLFHPDPQLPGQSGGPERPGKPEASGASGGERPRAADSCAPFGQRVPAVPYRSARHLPEPPNEARDAVRTAAAVLRAGGLVAFPTETVYGLGADARSAQAVARVFAAKGRPSTNPLIVHVTGIDMARGCVAEWPRRASLLANAFWPGPLSIILPRAAVIPDIVTGGGPGVAVRCPNHPMALALLFEFAAPVVGPSANRSGNISPTTAAHVREEFGGQGGAGGAGGEGGEMAVHVLDGGASAAGIESTVVSLLGPVPRVLRPGVISAAALAEALGEPVEHAGEHGVVAGSGQAMPAPGMLASHYAPHAPAVMVSLAELAAMAPGLTAGAAVVTHEPLPESVKTAARVIVVPAEAERYAKALYASLRQADGPGTERIVIARPPRNTGDAEADAIWEAIWDRLTRACVPRG